ncbi:hypothetical protein OROGR_029298 [Orobanche gracilis]
MNNFNARALFTYRRFFPNGFYCGMVLTRPAAATSYIRYEGGSSYVVGLQLFIWTSCVCLF